MGSWYIKMAFEYLSELDYFTWKILEMTGRDDEKEIVKFYVRYG